MICIGGSINIASGEEKEVPLFFSKFEFLWRLRYDSLRRLKRLFDTFLSYLIASLITKNLETKVQKLSNQIVYCWSCDYSNYTGEGNLARLFVSKKVKHKKIFYPQMFFKKNSFF